MAFEKIQASRSQSTRPTMRVYPAGGFNITKSALAIIGNAKRIELYWDNDAKRIGVCATLEGGCGVRTGKGGCKTLVEAHPEAVGKWINPRFAGAILAFEKEQ
jgi:hypothetical protein